jgi:hypothetical protein
VLLKPGGVDFDLSTGFFDSKAGKPGGKDSAEYFRNSRAGPVERGTIRPTVIVSDP